MMRRWTKVGAWVALVVMLGAPALAHCQIPCGIYDDLLRVRMMKEHVTTIERSLKGLDETLGKADAQSANQQVRWVINKEQHADLIRQIVTEYFLQQRIKAPAAGDAAQLEVYNERLATLHGILVASMKAKQTADAAHAATLRELIDRFSKSYFSEEDLKHLSHQH